MISSLPARHRHKTQSQKKSTALRVSCPDPHAQGQILAVHSGSHHKIEPKIQEVLSFCRAADTSAGPFPREKCLGGRGEGGRLCFCALDSPGVSEQGPELVSCLHSSGPRGMPERPEELFSDSRQGLRRHWIDDVTSSLAESCSVGDGSGGTGGGDARWEIMRRKHWRENNFPGT